MADHEVAAAIADAREVGNRFVADAAAARVLRRGLQAGAEVLWPPIGEDDVFGAAFDAPFDFADAEGVGQLLQVEVVQAEVENGKRRVAEEATDVQLFDLDVAIKEGDVYWLLELEAVAGEAGVPFFYQSGASFVQIYVGMGAKRVHELFLKAKAYAPSIIFIDEIDAVGKVRGGNRNDEREATLNQLLTEMDGFEDNSGVIVIAATNRIEMIDEALLRSGRFDRRIFLSMPDFTDRTEIVKSYLKDKNTSVEAQDVARISVGFSGAALSTLVNEAAINALRRGVEIIEFSDFESVLNKVLLGKKRILSYNDEEKRIQALYQGAKALAAYWFGIEFEKISLVEEQFMRPEREIESRSQMFARIKVCLAGISALKMVKDDTFSNSNADIQKAREIAQNMVFEYGMGRTFTPSAAEAEELLQEAYAEVGTFLAGMKTQLERISEYIEIYESIDKDALSRIIKEYYN